MSKLKRRIFITNTILVLVVLAVISLLKFSLPALMICGAVLVWISNKNYKTLQSAAIKIKNTIETLPGHQETSQISEIGDFEILEDSFLSVKSKIKELRGRSQKTIEEFRLASQLAGQPIIIVDENLNIIFLNKCACDIFGFNESQAAGEKLIKIVLDQKIESMATACIASNQTFEINSRSFFPESKELSVVGQPVNNKCILMISDITPATLVNELRKDFVANASHELKTPVAAIKILAETMTSVAGEPKKVKTFSKKLLGEVQNLTRLVSDLLDLSKLEAINPDHKQISMNNAIENSISSLRPLFKSKRIKVTFNADSEYKIIGDLGQINMMLTNLIENAITYTQEKGSVKVGLSSNEDRTILSVEDDGIGVPSKDIDRIFERFYRVDKARSRSTGGTGLGLSIVKHVVENHNGTVNVDSVVGEGTTFKVSLPAFKISSF